MDSAAAKEYDGRGHGLVICNLQRTEHDTDCVLRIFAELDVVMAALLSELRLHGDAVTEEKARPHAGARLDEDIYIVRGFDAATGEPSSNPAAIVEWGLRVGRYLRLTGGPYNGDIGRVIEKSASGHFKLRFDHSIDPTFGTRRRPSRSGLVHGGSRRRCTAVASAQAGRSPSSPQSRLSRWRRCQRAPTTPPPRAVRGCS